MLFLMTQFPIGLSSGINSKGTRRLTKRCAAVALALVLAFLHWTGAFAGSSLHNDPASLGYLRGWYNQKQFKFMVATDSHFGSWQGNTNSALALAHIAQSHPDAAFMIHMGDITETGGDEEYGLLKAHMAGLRFPVMATMGNHESRWQDPRAQDSGHFGPSTYSFDYGMWHFVVLDTCTLSRPTVRLNRRCLPGWNKTWHLNRQTGLWLCSLTIPCSIRKETSRIPTMLAGAHKQVSGSCNLLRPRALIHHMESARLLPVS